MTPLDLMTFFEGCYDQEALVQVELDGCMYVLPITEVYSVLKSSDEEGEPEYEIRIVCREGTDESDDS